MNRAATIVGSVLMALTLSAHAQLVPPPGWTNTLLNGSILMYSPGANPNSRVGLLLFPVAAQGAVRPWFTDQTISLAQAVGRPLGASDVGDHEGILYRVVKVEDKTGQKLRIVFYSYATPTAFQMLSLVIPPTVGNNDPRVQTAESYVQLLAARKFDVALALTAPPPVAQPGPMTIVPARRSCPTCYTSKPVPPKERDVPLAGVYAHVGISFGPTMSSIDTPMTWSQKVKPELLLLFANGVAVKVDAMGGNLVGSYQAEGFATLDVSDPSGLTGVPFGRWTLDGNTVQIRWNSGSSMELLKNGADLEGPGGRWTAYSLADGVRLEGVFRRAEPGVTPESIALHNDGTFAEDGVNTTMGGSIVMPDFPERGTGRYEIRKGSLILYFGNGFTQAIAFTIVGSGANNVRGILIHEFPFPRVR